MDGKQKSVAAITQELQNCSEEALIALCSNLRTDPRKSVQLLAEKAMKRLEKEKKEPETAGGMALDCFLEAVTEWAGKKQYAEALSFVMDYRHAHHAPVKKRARLEL